MPESLINLDKSLFLSLNHFSAPGVDPVMRFLSGPVPWTLFILGFLLILWITPRERFQGSYLIMLVSLILAYALSDQSSVHLFKEVFMRLRPCHEPSLDGQVRLVVDSCGGQFGFVSSHAANSFSLALLASFLINRRWFSFTVLSWAVLISYSRIYVGVHYPGDVLGGMALGCLIATGVFLILKIIHKPRHINKLAN